MATPLINPLRVSGGTMYAFSSGVRDMQKALMDNDIIFSFSKFALLDLPNVDGNISPKQNNIDWTSLSSTQPYPNNDLNIAESFQNYLLNHEEVVLSSPNYDNSIPQTPAEPIFWKWLTKLNAIKFKKGLVNKTGKTGRYEEISSLDSDDYVDYRRVVQHIGNIDFVNNNGQYSEIFLNVPSHQGTTPTVLFKTTEDSNYKPNLTWFTNNNNFIQGRNEQSEHPAGLNLLALYDNPTQQTYNTADQFGLLTYTDKVVSGATVSISNMDGAVIDFDTTSYSEIQSDKTIDDFNSSENSQNFKFNIALIYYDIYKQSETTTTNRTTNLYGFLVLDNYNNEIEFAELKRFEKFKSNSNTGLNGNSYHLRFNMKIDTSVANLGLDNVINDYNKESLADFTLALGELQKASELLLDAASYNINTDERLKKLENFYLTQNDIDDINNRINTLSEQVRNADLAFDDKRALLNLIQQNTNNINSLIRGEMSNQISYNIDIIKSGDGIEVDRSVPNRLTLKNKTQLYNTEIFVKNLGSNELSFAEDNGNISLLDRSNIIQLGQFTNYYRYNSEQLLTRNLIINIEDLKVKWKRGQVFKLYFNKKINLDEHSIIIKTGYPTYKEIAIIDNSLVLSNYPIIEIVCIDEINLLFDINILR